MGSKAKKGSRKPTDSANATTNDQRRDDEPSAPTEEDLPIFFYMPNEKHGEFCQWYKTRFSVSTTRIAELLGHPSITDDNDDTSNPDPGEHIWFNCAEQFMMYCKAARFGDVERQNRILASDSPKEQKALGKGTLGFTNESWDQVKRQVVEEGNMAKFGQSRHLRGKLLSTGDRMLCEAAGRDRVWGIGYTAKHAMSFRDHWGENLLGQALMAVRERLREQSTRYQPWEECEKEGDQANH
ncbi:unnamed protein product [Clonostachys rosea]|uniref:NADAR domain-containing protein n=1 Tax=Bionectria ochroleuca TaxID=29856 RepID=A0ABY6U432_BIOOC|nr:unnamed protein product [Clonostachys rosea]